MKSYRLFQSSAPGGARFVCAPWAILWSDEQKAHRRLCMRVRLLLKPRPNNYTESCMADVAA